MRLFIVYLWNYIRVLLCGKLFKKKVGKDTHNKLLNKEYSNNTPSNKKPYLTYRSNIGLSSTPSHKKRIKNRNNRKRRHKK